MSTQAMALVKDFFIDPASSGLGLRSRHTSVLFMLADECQDDLTCWPSLTRIAAATKMARRSAVRVVAELNAMKGEGFEDGLVTVLGSYKEDEGWATNLYELHIPDVPRHRRKRRRLKSGVILSPVTKDESGVSLSPDSEQTGVSLSPVEKSTGDKRDTKLVTKTTESRDENDTQQHNRNIQKELLLLPEAAESESEKSSSSETAAPGQKKQQQPTLDERLQDVGIYDHLISRILVNCPHDRIRDQLKIYEDNLDKGATHEVGVLVVALTGGPDVKPVKQKRKRKDAARVKSYEPTKPEPPHEVCMTCAICATQYSGRSDESLDCPGCGTGPYDQQIPGLVEKGIMPSSRLEKLPAKAREILKSKAEVEAKA